jgi:hypothetical protein
MIKDVNRPHLAHVPLELQAPQDLVEKMVREGTMAIKANVVTKEKEVLEVKMAKEDVKVLQDLGEHVAQLEPLGRQVPPEQQEPLGRRDQLGQQDLQVPQVLQDLLAPQALLEQLELALLVQQGQ